MHVKKANVYALAFAIVGTKRTAVTLSHALAVTLNGTFRVTALGLLGEGWDLIIAHPPCTYLSVAGAGQLYKGGVLNEERYSKGLEAKAFFMKFINAPCEKICVENPRQFKIFEMPAYTQEIQPWMFGHATTKATRLWLKGLPPLKPTNIVKPKTTTQTAGNWYNKAKPGVDIQTQRSKTFWGIARAMADQWG